MDFRVQPQSFLKNPKLSLENLLILDFFCEPQFFLNSVEFSKNGIKTVDWTKNWPPPGNIILNEAENFLMCLFLLLILNIPIIQPGHFLNFFLFLDHSQP